MPADELHPQLDERLRYFIRNCQPISGDDAFDPNTGEIKEKAGHLYLGNLLSRTINTAETYVCSEPWPLEMESWDYERVDQCVHAYLDQCLSHANEEFLVRACCCMDQCVLQQRRSNSTGLVSVCTRTSTSASRTPTKSSWCVCLLLNTVSYTHLTLPTKRIV